MRPWRVCRGACHSRNKLHSGAGRDGFETASALVLTYGTSYYALKDRAYIKPGENLLVMGAAGGVGLAAVELGKAMGARVIAAASSQDKLDVCREHGADETILYPSGELDRDRQRAFSDAIKELQAARVPMSSMTRLAAIMPSLLCARPIGTGAIW